MLRLVCISLILGVCVVTLQARPIEDPYSLYVVGSAPGASSTDAIDNDAGLLPGYNHVPVNQTSSASPSGDTSLGEMFDGTCRYLKLVGNDKVGQTSLDAQCVDEQGQWWDTSLNLNSCLGNEAGKLVYRPEGDFDTSCRPCVAQYLKDKGSFWLKCTCIDDDDTWAYSSVPLGSNMEYPMSVRPVEGRLICGDRLGSKAPDLSNEVSK